MNQIATKLMKTAFARSTDGAKAAEKCIQDLGSIDPKMLLVFCGGKLDGQSVLNAFQNRYGCIPIVGGAASGGIVHSQFGYSGLELAVLAITDPEFVPAVFSEPDLRQGEYTVAKRLGKKVAANIERGDTVLLFFDSVASASPPRLHHATPIVRGFYDGCGSIQPKLIGGGTLTDLNFSGGWVYDGSSVRHHALVALAWPPSVTVDTFVMHGCVPASSFLTITRMEGAEVFELDGRPALQVLEQQFGVSFTHGEESRALTLLATLGQKQGDPYAPYDENAYVNRLLLTCDPNSGSVTLFEPDFQEGARVQIMGRDASFMLDSVRTGVAAANRVIERGDSLVSIYINCAGRASVLSGSPEEETAVLTQSLDANIPLIGFYSGVEIAPFENALPRALDWTGLLAILRYRA
ncbi:hypothetical protein E9232_006353 [Inquilinus ginsengisoli]|uniref:Histidine kinase n=1 Tax=Inquilinus ginsengisoli TaxID=363840 RepID=A0ABU1JYU5_9PROT|nr:FIST N-terminal domain-containing protein [Inquilinus ginsengisoli]MDR6293800.1 hypothetical protein [Inquilinus ginsengisoli]